MSDEPVFPVVDNEHPERNGFYRKMSDGSLERVPGWTAPLWEFKCRKPDA